ncbi:MAG: oligosaccharide flippase family protein [Calditrichota bacterium]
MIKQVKQLFSDTFIYGIGYIVPRLVTFLLLPFYTNILTQTDYGIITQGMVFAGLLKILYKYGTDSALIRFYDNTEPSHSRKTIYSTLFWSVTITSLLLSGIVLLFTHDLSALLFNDSKRTTLILLLTGIIIFDTLDILPRTLLRIHEKPIYYSTINLVNVLITFGLNILFIAYLSMGVTGAFLANLIASGSLLLFLLPAMFRDLGFTFSIPRWKELLAFGLPLIQVGLASMVMELIDRPILKEMTNLATVGLYGAGYKLGIFMMLVMAAFNFAWQPFFVKVGQQDDGPHLFATIFTYFLFIICGLFIVLTMLLKYIVTTPVFGYTLIGKAFLPAITISPIIFAAYIFYGVYLNFLPGVYLKKRSGRLAIYTTIGAIVNVIGNLLLIPVWGIQGAAMATMIGYLVMAVLLYFTQQALYPTPYQWNKVTITLGITGAIILIFYIFHPGILVRLLLIASYGIFHLVFGFIRPEELRRLTKIVQARSRR